MQLSHDYLKPLYFKMCVQSYHTLSFYTCRNREEHGDSENNFVVIHFSSEKKMANINHAVHSPGSPWFAFIYTDGNGKSVEKVGTKYARVIHHAELREKKILIPMRIFQKIHFPSYRLEHTQSLFLRNT